MTKQLPLEQIVVSTTAAPVRKGARFHLGVNRPADIRDFLGPDTAIPEKYHGILKTLADLCGKDPEGKTDAHSVAAAAGLTLPTIHVYADRLVSLGLFTKQKLRPKLGRPPTLYTMLGIDTFLQSNAARLVAVGEEDDREREGDGGNVITVLRDPAPDLLDPELVGQPDEFVLLPGRPGLYRAEIFSTYTLLSVLRLGKSGRRTTGSYAADVHIGPARMRIKVSAQAGYAIAGIMDTKALIGICTYARSYYAEAANRQKPLVIDLSEFTSFLRLAPSGGNKRHVWKAVRAWEKTGFQVIVADDSIRQLFGPRYFALDEFRFITRIKTLIGGKTPERIAITLEEGLLQRILDPTSRFLSAIHSDIMTETSAARMLFYFWCRRAVKYGLNPTYWDLRHLHREMAPYMYPSDFYATTRKIADKALNPDGTMRPLHGYFIRSVYDDTNRLAGYEIWADKKDRLIKSYHQRNPSLPSDA